MRESGEMYLETIYVLYQNQKNVRSIDVAEEMGFSKPSVSRGIGILRQNGYLTVDPNGYLMLTESGMETAQKIYERHTILTQALIAIGVNPETAQQDACRMEHVISDETLNAFKNHMNKNK